MENLFQTLGDILRPTIIETGKDFISFDFKIQLPIYTGNLSNEVKDILNSVEKIEHRGQYLYGYNGRECKFTAMHEQWTAEDLNKIEEDGRKTIEYLPEDRRHPHYKINSISTQGKYINTY